MNGFSQAELVARDGHRLKVLEICRISKTTQDALSLDDQEALYKEFLDRHTDLPYDLTRIAGQGSGECLDRKEYEQAIEAVESGEFDLVITEDLGRICRRAVAHIFCEMCVDHGTRLIAINDHVDTAVEGWETASFFACMRHESYNKDTSQRIRRTLRNRFQNGGVVQSVIYGHIKPFKGCKDSDLQKDPAAEPIYDEWFRKLENGASYCEVADWLNSLGIKPGPRSKLPKWDGHQVNRVTNNPILKGVRVRNAKISKRVNKSGRRKSVDAPPGERLERHCPHLAFIEPERYDRAIAMLKESNKPHGNWKTKTRSKKQGVKKRTRFPGQQLYCGVCGRMLLYGAHGQMDHLFCSGARMYRCWQSTSVDGPLAAEQLSQAVFDKIANLPGFDDSFREQVEQSLVERESSAENETTEIVRRIEQIDRQISNIVKFICDGRASVSLQDELTRLEGDKRELQQKQNALMKRPRKPVVIPCVDELRSRAADAFKDLSIESPEFSRQMRRLISAANVFPYRSIDGGPIVLRAIVALNLVSLAPELHGLSQSLEILSPQFVIDLFKQPQRIVYRKQVMEGRRSGRTEADVAHELRLTVTAAQRAAHLSRLMDTRGLSDPYFPVKEPSIVDQRQNRHEHVRFAFQPLDGFPHEWPV